MTEALTENIRFELRDADIDHPALRNALLVVVKVGDVLKPVGTAVSVVPGLAFTASHVIDPTRWSSSQKSDEGPAYFALQFHDGMVWVWNVDAIYGSVAYEIAVLTLRKPDWWENAPSELKRKFPRLNFNPPQLGDEVQVFGFPETEFEDGVFTIKPSQCVAVVESLTHDCEDPEVPRSHVKLRGQILNGMSGGPCFDKNFDLVGINQGGFSFRYEVYVSLLWSAMRFEIDLLKTGSFPVIELFNQGPVKALGYRRVQVTPEGDAFIGKVDPDSLVPIWLYGSAEAMESRLNFAASNAQSALAEMMISFEEIKNDSKPLDENAAYLAVNRFFNELDSALRIALMLAAIQLKLEADHPLNWDELLEKWRAQYPSEETSRELAALNFNWYGVDLFEIRTYTELGRGGALHLIKVSGESLKAVILESARRGGRQYTLPEGLEHFFIAARGFVQRLLKASLPSETNA